MTKLFASIGRIAALLLVTLSPVGVVTSFHQLYSLEMIESALEATKVLRGTVGTKMRTTEDKTDGTSKPLNSPNSLDEEISSVEQEVLKAIGEFRSIQRLDMTLWVLVFVTAFVSLVAYRARTER